MSQFSPPENNAPPPPRRRGTVDGALPVNPEITMSPGMWVPLAQPWASAHPAARAPPGHGIPPHLFHPQIGWQSAHWYPNAATQPPPSPPAIPPRSPTSSSSDESYSVDFVNDEWTIYSFRPSRGSPNPSSIQSTSVGAIEEDDINLEDEGGLSLPGPGPRPIPSHISHIFQSRYVGDSSYGAHHSAKLITSENPTPRHGPLFRWFHFETITMDFDAFSARVLSIDKLSKVEMDGIKKMLSTVRRDALRVFQTPDGEDRNKMAPSCYRESLPTDPTYKGLASRAISWACLPHFSLERYSGLYADNGSLRGTPCQIQTLLQSVQPHASKQRDLEQIVSQVQGHKGEPRCLHISQVWCLVLGNCKELLHFRCLSANPKTN